jgi:DNA-binding response OmpR family regulator
MTPAPPRLLIVDDEEAISFAMGDYLGRSGFRVDRARTQEEAEALFAGPEPYDLVIADLRLSTRDLRGGLDLIRRVRGRFPEIRIILLTAYGSAEVEAELSRFGNAVLLSKPQPLSRIAEEVSRLLSRPSGSAPFVR